MSCPRCGSDNYSGYDTVTRKVKIGFGNFSRVRIPRNKCKRCGRIWRDTPKYLYSHKQYHRAIIDGVREGHYGPWNLALEDYPCEKTMQRWRENNAALDENI